MFVAVFDPSISPVDPEIFNITDSTAVQLDKHAWCGVDGAELLCRVYCSLNQKVLVTPRNNRVIIDRRILKWCECDCVRNICCFGYLQKLKNKNECYNQSWNWCAYEDMQPERYILTADGIRWCENNVNVLNRIRNTVAKEREEYIRDIDIYRQVARTERQMRRDDWDLACWESSMYDTDDADDLSLFDVCVH